MAVEIQGVPRTLQGDRVPRRRATDRPQGYGIVEATPRAATARRDAIFRRALAVADVLAAIVAVAATTLLAPDLARPWTLLGLPLLVFVVKSMGLYDRDELVVHKTTLDDVPALFQVSTLVTLIGAILQPALREDPHRIVLLWVMLFAGLICLRVAARRAARALTPPERCVLVGDIRHATRLRRMLEADRELGAELVAAIRFDQVTARGEDAEAFSDYLAQADFHRVIVTHSDTEAMLETIRVFKSRGIKVSVLPSLFDVLGSAVEFDDLSGATLLGVRRYGLTRSSRLLKRAFDIAGASLALVALAPALALIALLIRRDSAGPVFYRQIRVGRGGRRFEIVKFRTMRVGADRLRPALGAGAGLFKLTDDPRVTRVGRLLRSTSLDELPQLLNVLRGEMSLVGPRPLVVEEDSQINGWHRRRLDLTPGMTGVWQTLRSTRPPLDEMVALDYLYIVNWSLWADIKILLRTIPHVLSRAGL